MVVLKTSGVHDTVMSSYDVEPCNFKYRVSSLAKVVDGDTIDVNIDLGFDVSTQQRVRLLGIDTPESRTSDKEEKKFGLLSKKKLKEWCMKAVASREGRYRDRAQVPRGRFAREIRTRPRRGLGLRGRRLDERQ